MTISADYKPINYISDGVSVTYYINWVFLDNDVEAVNEDGVRFENYSILRNSDGKGSIVFAAPLEKGTKVVVRRCIPLNQSISFNEGAPFPADEFEYALDRIYMILQEMGYDISRSLVLPEKYKNFEEYDRDIVRFPFTNKAEWDSSIDYEIKDLCFFNDVLYVNIRGSNKGVRPDIENSGWEKIANLTYNKQEIDFKVSQKVDAGDVYLKDEVYSKGEIDDKIGNIDEVLDNINGEII